MNFFTICETVKGFKQEDVDFAIDYFIDNYETISKEELKIIEDLIARPVYDLLFRIRREFGVNYPDEFNYDLDMWFMQDQLLSKFVSVLSHILTDVSNIFSKSEFTLRSRESFKNVVSVFGQYIKDSKKEINNYRDGPFFNINFINLIPDVEKVHNFLKEVIGRTSVVFK